MTDIAEHRTKNNNVNNNNRDNNDGDNHGCDSENNYWSHLRVNEF